MEIIHTIPVNDRVRVSWVFDHDIDVSWMDPDTRRAWKANLLVGPYGCIIETKCCECGSWITEDSLWGIFEKFDTELTVELARDVHGMDIPS